MSVNIMLDVLLSFRSINIVLAVLVSVNNTRCVSIIPEVLVLC